VAQGRAKLVVGARSALYLPFPELRLIVIDEEHDTSYKQEEGVIYNARDMAVVKASISKHAVILASATPSLESLVNARSGRYGHVILPQRPGAITLPTIDLVDLKDSPPTKGDFISPPLIDAIQSVLVSGDGPGVERVAEEAARHFPDAKIEIFSSDTAGNPKEIAARMKRMESGEIDILVGTQMVVKGHNFPHLTFVGVVDGDLGLAGGDPRAGERTYQTLVQVAGRAGRADKPGTALIQTHQPEHEALSALAAGDRERFISAELANREMLGLPPYGKLAGVIISGPDMKKTEDLANKFVSFAPRADGIDILGPSEPPIGRLRGLFRRRILIQSEPTVNLSKYMRVWRARIKMPAKYKLHIDIDPQGFM